jgi:hypothetical protein
MLLGVWHFTMEGKGAAHTRFWPRANNASAAGRRRAPRPGLGQCHGDQSAGTGGGRSCVAYQAVLFPAADGGQIADCVRYLLSCVTRSFEQVTAWHPLALSRRSDFVARSVATLPSPATSVGYVRQHHACCHVIAVRKRGQPARCTRCQPLAGGAQ